MLIRYGYTVELEFSQPTPVITILDIHPERRHDILNEKELTIAPETACEIYRDRFNNICRRFMAPAGLVSLHSEGLVRDSGDPEEHNPDAREVPVEEVPSDMIMYLMGSRYCDTDKLSDVAWNLFGKTKGGYPRVQAICDFAHDRIKFGYPHARSTRSASEAFEDQVGVCRDFAHLAVALCRCMNIPARYTTGYLGDIGVPREPTPMDFSAWFEAYIGDRWYSFDARHNMARIGRIVMGYGLDAADVAIVNSFGRHTLKRWEVVTDEVDG